MHIHVNNPRPVSILLRPIRWVQKMQNNKYAKPKTQQICHYVQKQWCNTKQYSTAILLSSGCQLWTHTHDTDKKSHDVGDCFYTIFFYLDVCKIFEIRNSAEIAMPFCQQHSSHSAEMYVKCYFYILNKAKLHLIVNLHQWFSTFFPKRNPKKTFQWLEEPPCNNSTVLCKKTAFNFINKMKICVTSGGTPGLHWWNPGWKPLTYIFANIH